MYNRWSSIINDIRTLFKRSHISGGFPVHFNVSFFDCFACLLLQFKLSNCVDSTLTDGADGNMGFRVLTVAPPNRLPPSAACSESESSRKWSYVVAHDVTDAAAWLRASSPSPPRTSLFAFFAELSLLLLPILLLLLLFRSEADLVERVLSSCLIIAVPKYSAPSLILCCEYTFANSSLPSAFFQVSEKTDLHIEVINP